MHTDPLGLATVSANFSGDFTGGGFGSDGPGSGLFKLVLTGSNVASGLFALDATDTTTDDGDGIGQGTQIVLNQSGDVITGSVGATTYFTISIDESTGVVTFTQVNNIWHSDPNNPDDAATLTLANADLLRLVQTLTDADGDTAPASLNLGTGVFTIQDCWPDREHGDWDGGYAGSGRVASGGHRYGRWHMLRSAWRRLPPTLPDNFSGGELRHGRCGQHGLYAGADRHERGLRAVCAG